MTRKSVETGDRVRVTFDPTAMGGTFRAWTGCGTVVDAGDCIYVDLDEPHPDMLSDKRVFVLPAELEVL